MAFLQLGLRLLRELESDHHLRGQEVGRGRVRSHLEEAGEGHARLVGLPGQDVDVAEKVGQLQVVRGPGPRPLEVGDGLRQAACEVERETQDLHGLPALDRALRQLVHHRREHLDRLDVVVRVIVRDALQVADTRISGIEGGELLEGVVDVALIDEGPGLGKTAGRVGRSARILRGDTRGHGDRSGESPGQNGHALAALHGFSPAGGLAVAAPVPSVRVSTRSTA